jgi:hypothetical protein
MTGEDLIEHLRESILDDAVIPHLWSDSELLRYLNYSEVQACRRAHLLIDSSTANDSGTAGTASTAGQKPLCTLSVVANTAVYYLSPKILMIKRCQLKSMTYPLPGPVSYEELDDQLSGWLGTSGTIGTAGSGGFPTFFLNEPPNTITFVRAPSSSDTAMLVVSRIPLVSFTLKTSPEVEEKYHIDLCDWAAHLAYLKPDSETINLNLAKYYEDSFTAKFGPLPTAHSERWLKTVSMKQRMRPREFGS